MSSSHDRRRDRVDRLATLAARLGGGSVILLLALMFLFLLREALPLATELEWRAAAAPEVALREGRAVGPAPNPRWALEARYEGGELRLLENGAIAARVASAPPRAMAWSPTGGTLVVAAGGELRRLILHRSGGGWRWNEARGHEPPPQVVDLVVPRPDEAGFVAVAGSTLYGYRFHDAGPRGTIDVGFPVEAAAFSGPVLVLSGAGRRAAFELLDPYPRSSMNALWRPVQHEYRQASAHVWQPTSVTALGEPKFSLVPLVWGTLKAAVLGCLFGAPVALLAAVHVAFFARSGTRRWVKPVLELTEGLPTVVIGLVALLLLAPWIERHLLAFLLLLALLPVTALASSWLATLLEGAPGRDRSDRLPWLTLPLLALGMGLALWLGMQLEAGLDGGLAGYLERTLGWQYQTRNALLVGLVVGLAIIPSVFTLAEDAVFGVPTHVARGAFALGASRWEAFRTVVLPLAAAGMLAAVIIGFARAVGETMIVLMVSGNAPLLDASPFTGLRSLTASLALELPESAPGSEHYRVLFLAALLLFAATFLFNALAEWVRSRLRRRYRLAP